MQSSSIKSVVIVTNQLKNIKSGVGTVANALIKELVKNYDLLIICPEKEYTKLDDKRISIITVADFKVDLSNHRWLSFGYKASSITRELNPDLYKLVIYMDAREGLFASRSPIPSLGIIHDFMSAKFSKLTTDLVKIYPDWFIRYIYYSALIVLEKRAYKNLSHLVTVSDYAKQKIIEYYNVKKPITVILNGIDFSLFPKPTNNKHPNTVLFVCGNPYLKGLPQLLQAISIVAKEVPNIKLFVAGKANNKFRKLQSDHVEFMGQLSYKKLLQYFNYCQIFCMPSRFESLSMAYLEALYYNMQVVASKNTGITEIKKYFSNLHIIDPDNVQEIALAIKISLKLPEPKNRQNMEEISSKKMGQGYIKLVSSIVNRSPDTKSSKVVE